VHFPLYRKTSLDDDYRDERSGVQRVCAGKEKDYSPINHRINKKIILEKLFPWQN
jgi:hypothetical protein